jgi:hypothetical protein
MSTVIVLFHYHYYKWGSGPCQRNGGPSRGKDNGGQHWGQVIRVAPQNGTFCRITYKVKCLRKKEGEITMSAPAQSVPASVEEGVS